MKSLVLLPHVTEKSLSLTGNGQYQFIAPLWATKKQISDHVTRHFSVTVIDVSSTRMPSVNVTFRRQHGRRAAWKKTTVQLKPGETIAEFNVPVEHTPQPTDDKPETPEPTNVKSKITVRSKSKKEPTK